MFQVNTVIVSHEEIVGTIYQFRGKKFSLDIIISQKTKDIVFWDSQNTWQLDMINLRYRHLKSIS